MADLDTLKAEQAKLTEQRQDLVESMDAAAQEIVAALVRFLPDKWDEIVAETRRSQASHLLTLPKETLTETKASLSNLKARAGELVPPFFDTDAVWHHRQKEPTAYEGQSPGYLSTYAPIADRHPGATRRFSIPPMLREQYRKAVGLIGEVIRPLIAPNDYRASVWARSDWKVYNGPSEVNSDVEEAIREYDALDRELRAVHLKLRNLAFEITQTEASNVWDEA